MRNVSRSRSGWRGCQYGTPHWSRRMFRPSFAIALAILPASVSGQVISDAELRTRVDSFVSRRVADDAFSGVVLVARKGTVVYQRAARIANRQTGAPINADTRLQIASIPPVRRCVARERSTRGWFMYGRRRQQGRRRCVRSATFVASSSRAHERSVTLSTWIQEERRIASRHALSSSRRVESRILVYFFFRQLMGGTPRGSQMNRALLAAR